MQNTIHACHRSVSKITSKIKDRLIGCAALVALALLTIANTDPAHAVKMESATPIGQLKISVDTTLSAGVGIRLNEVLEGRVASQSGGTDRVRGLDPAQRTDSGFRKPGYLSRITTAQGDVGFKDDSDKNFAGNQNNDDGRLNFQDGGDITGATFKALSEIEANLETKFGDVNFFTRLSAYYDPVLYSPGNYTIYDRGKPGPSGLRQLGADILLLDVALGWNGTIPTGYAPIGDLPVSLKIGKLAANDWGEAMFSFTGLSQGIVLDVPAARRPGAQIKEIIEGEYMAYGSISLPFGIGIDVYYQFHHTPWTLNESDGPFSISDLPNPSSPDASYLWFSGSSTSGTFRRNCDGTGGFIADVIKPSCDVNSIVDYRKAFQEEGVFTNVGGLENIDARSFRAEDVRLALGDLLKAPVRILNADDQGQFGAQISYSLPYLNGIELNASYQNVHSRLPYGRIISKGQPTVTIAVIEATGTVTQNSLHGRGCTGEGQGGFLGADGTGGDTNNNFVDTSIKSGANDSNVSLKLDPRHFGRTRQERLNNFLALADNAFSGLKADIATIRGNRITHWDVALINCAIYKNAIKAIGSGDTLRTTLTAEDASLANLSPIGTEYLALQYNVGLDLFYPQNLKIIGVGFNMTVPWLEWGLRAEVAWRPDTPLQQSVTEQVITVANAQGVGTAYGDAAAIVLAPLDTTSLDETYDKKIADESYKVDLSASDADKETARTEAREAVISQARTDVTQKVKDLAGDGDGFLAYINSLGFSGQEAFNLAHSFAGSGGISSTQLQAIEDKAVESATPAADAAGQKAYDALEIMLDNTIGIAAGFNSDIYKGTMDGTYQQSGILERDMLNITLGTSALYNASHPVARALKASQFAFLTEFNVIYFLQDLPKGWDGNSTAPIGRNAKHRTLQCARTTGTELPLGSFFGLDTVSSGCSPDQVSLGYTIYAHLDYSNIFGSAWRFRPSVALRHGAYGNTPSPLPGWRQDTLALSAGLEFAFQNSLTLAFNYVGYFAAGSDDYNINGGFDTASFSISYAF